MRYYKIFHFFLKTSQRRGLSIPDRQNRVFFGGGSKFLRCENQPDRLQFITCQQLENKLAFKIRV